MNINPVVQKQGSSKRALPKRKKKIQPGGVAMPEISTSSSNASTTTSECELQRYDSRLDAEEAVLKRPKLRIDVQDHDLGEAKNSLSGVECDQQRIRHITKSSHKNKELDDGEDENGHNIAFANMPNNAANKVQLRQRFFDLHFGATGHISPAFAYEVLDITNPKKTALTAAMDTLCVAQLATTFRDERLAATSRILYGQAIHRLNEKISRISRQNSLQPGQLDEIIGSIYALVPSAWFDCVGTDKTDWIRHTQGLNRIIEIYGWQTLGPEIKERYRKHWERRAFTNAMIQRKRIQADCFHGRDDGTDTSFFKRCAVDVPGLLQRSDTLLKTTSAKRTNAAAVIDVLTALGNSVSTIKKWQLHWASEHINTFRVVDVKTYKSFSHLAKRHIKVFPLVYTFAKAELEREIRLSHICLLAILQSIMDIHTAYANLCTEPELRMQLEAATHEAKVAADNLCMHVPWSAQPHFMAFACTYSLVPLYYAAEYYRKQGYEDHFSWCKEVSNSLSEKYGISIDFSLWLVDWVSEHQTAPGSRNDRIPRRVVEDEGG